MFTRRSFMSWLAGVLPASLLLGKTQSEKTTKSEQWWEEYPFEFDGNPGTLFVFPPDQVACLQDDKDQITVPSFDLRVIGKDIETELRETLAFARKENSIPTDKPVYIHYITYAKTPASFALLISANCRKFTPSKIDYTYDFITERTKAFEGQPDGEKKLNNIIAEIHANDRLIDNSIQFLSKIKSGQMV